MSQRQTSHLRPSTFLKTTSPHEDRALIILNQPVNGVELLDRVWHSCSLRICADGGANHLHDLCRNEHGDIRTAYLPSLIHGDLDSLRADVRSWYEDQGVEVSRDPDQYSTDFGKAISNITARTDPIVNDLVILGSIAGRVDQGLGLLSEIAREQAKHPHIRLWLVSEISLSWIVQGNQVEHVFSGLQDDGVFTENIGVLPIYGPSRITTQGLEWDVDDWLTEMSGNVSTSNHIKSDVVTLKTTSNVLITIERKKNLPPL